MIKKMVIMLWALALIVGLAGCAANVPRERLAAPSPLPPDPFADADAEAREVRSLALGGYNVKPIGYDGPLSKEPLVYDGTPYLYVRIANWTPENVTIDTYRIDRTDWRVERLDAYDEFNPDA